MRRAARQNEQAEEPEQAAKRQLAPTIVGELDEHGGNGEIRRPDQKVGDVVQAQHFTRPHAALRARNETVAGKKFEKNVDEVPPETEVGFVTKRPGVYSDELAIVILSSHAIFVGAGFPRPTSVR